MSSGVFTTTTVDSTILPSSAYAMNVIDKRYRYFYSDTKKKSNSVSLFSLKAKDYSENGVKVANFCYF